MINNTDNVFDVLETIAKITVLGCTGTLSVLLQGDTKNNTKLIKNLINVAKRYENNESYDFLQNILETNKCTQFQITNINHGDIMIRDTPQLHDHYVQQPIQYTNQNTETYDNQIVDTHKRDYFDVYLLCVTIRLHCTSDDFPVPSFCTIM